MTENKTEYRFLKACRREKTDCTPVWMMRQAGRYMPEYRAIREKHTFMEMCHTPELAVEVTLQPLRKIDLDAAILFSDILIPVEAMGIEIEFLETKGPVMNNPARTERDIAALKVIETEQDVPFVMEAIRMLRKELEGKVPLIGFSGAPFTLGSYMVEASHSRNYILIKQMMYNEPGLYRALMEKITETVIRYFNAQVEAGAQVLQMFDSWIGALSPYDYEKYALPYSKRVIESVSKDVPFIHFGTGYDGYLDLITEAGGDVIGVDWKMNLDDAWKVIGYDRGIQGNLDPVTLLGPQDQIREKVQDILDRAAGRPGHIFNLGHGILPPTPVENAVYLIDTVHELSSK